MSGRPCGVLRALALAHSWDQQTTSLTTFTQSLVGRPCKAGGVGTGDLDKIKKGTSATCKNKVWITLCARLRTFISPIMPVNYLGPILGMLGAAGNVGTQG